MGAETAVQPSTYSKTPAAAINVSNIVMAQRDPAGGEPHGTTVDLARELARRLGVGIELVRD